MSPESIVLTEQKIVAEDPSDSPRGNLLLISSSIVAGLILCGMIIGGLVFFSIGSDLLTSAERRCLGNLRQIGRAMNAYHADYGCFPPAYLADENGKPMHSWRILLLPYLGEHELYAQYRFDQPWDSPDNQPLVNERPDVYLCPDHPGTSVASTSYMMIVGTGTISDGPGSTSLADIRDGLNSTILVTEITKPKIHWINPSDLTLDPTFNCMDSGHQDRKVYYLSCDGLVQTVRNPWWWGLDDFMKKRATIAGSE